MSVGNGLRLRSLSAWKHGRWISSGRINGGRLSGGWISSGRINGGRVNGGRNHREWPMLGHDPGMTFNQSTPLDGDACP